MNYEDWFQLLGRLMATYGLARQVRDVPVPFEHIEDRGDEEIVFSGTCVRRKKVRMVIE